MSFSERSPQFNPKEAIAQAETLEELIEIFKRDFTLEGSSRPFSSAEMLEGLQGLQEDPYGPFSNSGVFTQALGLREKVLKLWAKRIVEDMEGLNEKESFLLTEQDIDLFNNIVISLYLHDYLAPILVSPFKSWGLLGDIARKLADTGFDVEKSYLMIQQRLQSN